MLKKSVALGLLGLLLLNGCRGSDRAAEKLAEDSSAAQDVQSNLTFTNITLSQADDDGKPLWNVKAAQAVYSPDKKIATVKEPAGELFQDGKAIYHIEAKTGVVRQDGDRVILRDQVMVRDLKSGAVLRGDSLEWIPKQDLLTVKGNLKGTHPEVNLVAQQMQLANRTRRMTLSGKVAAESTTEAAVGTTPNSKLQLFADRMVWLIDQKRLTSDQPVQVQQLQGETVTDQATSRRAEANLGNKTVQLKQNARLQLLDPPLNVTGDSLLWNLTNKTVVADQPLTIVHRQQKLLVNADRGRMNLASRLVDLTGNVRAISETNQSRLTANSLTWNVPNQVVNAEGNVQYVQADPPMTLRGNKGVGRLADRTIVVTGGSSGNGQVVTEVIPRTVN